MTGTAVAIKGDPSGLVTALEASSSDELTQLGIIASREHELVEEALESAVEHAFRAGDALNRAFALVPKGEWTEWVTARFAGGYSTATWYRRMATYKEVLIEHGITSQEAARSFLAEAALHLESNPVSNLPIVRISDGVRAEIRALAKEGMTPYAIARTVGVADATVYRALAGAEFQARERKQKRERRRRRKAERLAFEREQQRAEAKAHGGELGKAFDLTLKAIAFLDAARPKETGDKRRLIEESQHAAYKSRDLILKAMRTPDAAA